MLVANLKKMGRKQLDRTPHEGQFVICTDLAVALQAEGLTGFSISPVRHFSAERADPNYSWLKIVSEWPRMLPRRILAVEDPCPNCERAGHFDTHKRASEFWYQKAPAEACDFNSTWEYFGVWRHHLWTRTYHVGGRQMAILSQRAQAFLLRHKVKHVSFDPVFFDSPNP